MKLEKKRVAVIGLGKSGFAAAKFLAEKKCFVRVTDASQKKEVLENAGYLRGLGIEVETGAHTENFLKGAELIVTSPGVPKTSLPLIYAKKNHIRVISEIELAGFFCPGPIIGVTGSNGKTTTSHLIHRLLSAAGKKSVLCGNVGYSFLEAIQAMDAKTIAVVELSSFQLEDSPSLRPEVAVVLNVSPNHLDRHGTMAAYTKAKEKIFSNQGKVDTLILNHDDARVRAMAKKARSRIIFFSKKTLRSGVFVSKDQILIRHRIGKVQAPLEISGFALEGDHNLENILAAVSTVSLFGVPTSKMRGTLHSFKTLEHRIERLGEIDGVHFINDSKSTTLDSTRAALSAFQGSMILIAGGRDKGAPFAKIENLVAKKVRWAVLYGEAAPTIAGAWKKFKHVKRETDFKKAVRLALACAQPGDKILLSPMCTSFDQFNSYEHRGETFKELFESLKKEKSWKR